MNVMFTTTCNREMGHFTSECLVQQVNSEITVCWIVAHKNDTPILSLAVQPQAHLLATHAVVLLAK